MTQKNNYRLKFIIIILLGLFSCQSKNENINLICNNDFKYWVCSNWDSEIKRFFPSYIRFGKDGSFEYYQFNQNGMLEPKIEEPPGLFSNDIIYPNHWELKNDSTIVYRKNNLFVYEKKIIYLTKDTMILSYGLYYPGIDTLFALRFQ